VAELSLKYLGVRPDGTRQVKLSTVADYATGDDPAKAAYAALEPEDSALVAKEKSAEPPLDNGRGESVKVPALDGLPIRAAVQSALEKGFVPVVEGSGRLSRSEPASGSRAPKGSKLVLVFEPPT
jgi:hypothetical protein